MKVLAFYLPQFHRIPENDEWWGEGFTEWVNMKKAKPLFDNHNQPRVPLNNNYYNLLDIETLRWQANLAKEYGVYGFCVYHYWFNGKLLLEKPWEILLENKDIDIPFCLCWANEPWNNGWVSDENRILMSQDFEDRLDWKKHFEYYLKFFKDDRYIKEDGKPLLVIYYPNIIGCLNEMLEYWNEEAKKHGFEGIKFIYQHPLFHYKKNADRSHFDYGIEFQPQFTQYKMKSKLQLLSTKIRTNLSIFLQNKFKIYIKLKQNKVAITSYDDIWNETLKLKPMDDKMIPGAFVDWDNTPRKGLRGSAFVGATPEKFKKYFKQQVQRAKKVYNKDMIFIFAWNEWAEGGYLEPDEKNKYGYLQAIKESLEELNEFPNK